MTLINRVRLITSPFLRTLNLVLLAASKKTLFDRGTVNSSGHLVVKFIDDLRSSIAASRSLSWHIAGPISELSRYCLTTE